MFQLDQAVITRYNAVGLPASIGQVFDEQQPEGSVLPYTSFENASDSRFKGTQANVYQKALVTFTIWGTSKEQIGPLCKLLEDTFHNSNNAPNSPLAMSSIGGIVNCLLTSPYIIKQVSDTIWSGTQTFTVLYRRALNLQPVP